MRRLDHVGHLPHQRRVAGSGDLQPDLDPHRLPQMVAHHVRDTRGDRRREEHGLTQLGDGAEDAFEVLRESHVEHLVRFIEDHHRDSAQVERPAGKVVESPTGRRDDDICAALERRQLPADRLSSVDGQHARPKVTAIPVDRLRDLDRKFARRHQHQGRWTPTPATFRQTLQKGQGEGGGLPRPSRSLAEQVSAFEKRRDRLALNRRRLFVAQFGQRIHELGSQAQIDEAHRVVVGVTSHFPSVSGGRGQSHVAGRLFRSSSGGQPTGWRVRLEGPRAPAARPPQYRGDTRWSRRRLQPALSHPVPARSISCRRAPSGS